MIIRQTPRLTLPAWQESDRDLFREINADDKVMEFFPFRRSHAEVTAVMERIGLKRDPSRDFNHSRVPADTHPHVTYALTLREW